MILATGLSLSAHAQNWSSAVNSGGAYYEVTTDVAEQSDGSRIVVGNYIGKTTPPYTGPVFGSFSLGYQNQGSGFENTNCFIVKFRADNTVAWATRISSPNGTKIASVDVDDNGNVYVCGSFSASSLICKFYSVGNVLNTTLYTTIAGEPNPTAGNRAYIAKYNSNGVLDWARLGIGYKIKDGECASEIAVSKDGTTLVCTGRILPQHSITVGSSTSSITNGSYVLWLDPADGSSKWGYNFTNDSQYEQLYKTGLCIDHDKCVIVAGKLNGAITYDVKGTSSTKPVTSNTSNTSTLYAKYSTTGVVEWAKVTNVLASPANGSIQSAPSSIVVDDQNRIYIGGWMNSPVNYQLQFPKSSGFESIPVNTADANHAFVVKLDTLGNALWKNFAKRTATGTEVVSLAKGPCNVVYAGINTSGENPSYVDASSATQTTSSPIQANMIVQKINTDGQFLSTNPWVILKIDNLNRAYISTDGTGKTHCAGTILYNPTSILINGTFTNFIPNSRDVFLASFTDNAPAPVLTLNPTASYCPFQNIPLTASASGTGPFTYTWDIWNNTSSTYVNLGTTSAGSFTLTPTMYNPHIFTWWGMQIIIVNVSVTNCSGHTSSESRIIPIKGNVTFTQVHEVSVCYGPSLPAPDAVFSVTAQNVDTYTWQYSSDNGVTWLPVGGNMIASLNMLTVDNPIPAQNGYLFRCIMTGCSSVVSNPALLTVIPCPMIAPGDEGPSRNKQTLAGNETRTLELSMYPNPANDLVKCEITSTEQDLSGEWLIMVYDMTGRKIHQQSLRDGRCTIQTSQFTNGNYLCVLKHNQEMISNKKLIVAH